MSTEFEDAISVAQTLLGGSRGEPLTQQAIAETVDTVLSLRPEWQKVIDRDDLIGELESRFNTWIGTWRTIEDNTDHVGWLKSQEMADAKWPFWNRYKLLLKQSWAPSAVDSLDKLTDDILGRLEQPKRSGPWDRRGLIVGHVQSGKTANYIGLINKAADAGYGVIVVLAGMHKNLRSQTQIRLDEGFLGYNSAEGLSPDGSGVIGVGKLDPSVRAQTVTTRADNGDFRKSVAKSLHVYPGDKPFLFVVKKNASVLRHLIEWAKWAADATDADTGKKHMTSVPLLLIDDEADHGSVDTNAKPLDEDGNADLEHDPTALNRYIRQLLQVFDKSAYVGYTATPFANIFIYDQAKTVDEGEDLFPRSFIINMPAPSTYVGPIRLFGLSANPDAGIESAEGLPVVRHIDDYVDGSDPTARDLAGWMPPRHKKVHQPKYKGQLEIPPSLRMAICSFILTCAARRARGKSSVHNSMLVHVTRFNAVQNLVTGQVNEALSDIKNRLRYGDGAAPEPLMKEMEALWEIDYQPTTRAIDDADCPEVSWTQVKQHLIAAVEPIQVREINGSAGDILEYEEYKEKGLSVIAIGGDKLSRGLTLEGLSVSYFLRASKMYDTLMQMGRWFGYRRGYVDLCRLFTTLELQEWFEYITDAAEELRLEFDHMVDVGGTPKDYGLRVRSHPVLMVTSAVKMRSGVQLELSFAGDISETVVFHNDDLVIHRNFDTLASSVRRLGAPDGRGDFRRLEAGGNVDSGTYLWTGVSPEEVCTFLRGVQTHPKARKVNCQLLAEFIEKQVIRGELVDWTVGLVSVKDGVPEKVGDLPVGLIKRSLHPTVEATDRYVIRRLLNPRDEAIDLDEEQYQRALERTRSAFQADPGRGQGTDLPDIPGGVQIRSVRSAQSGLLLLYPLQLANHGEPIETPAPVVGFGVSFPSSTSQTRVTYVVDNIYWQQEFDFGAEI